MDVGNSGGMFCKIDQGVVDGENWYRLMVSVDVLQWINEQNRDSYEHIYSKTLLTNFVVDITEELFLMIKIKFDEQ